MKNDPTMVLNLIAQTIYDKKGMNTLALDIREVSTITDFAVITEGNVDRHVVAIAKAILEALEQIGEKPLHVEGLQTGDWVVLDFLNFMVHIFMPGLRDKYQLEQLWKEGEILDLNIVISPESSRSYMRTQWQ